ncbi:hypothetical protein WOB69_20440 [Vibrio parahaemolyticus]|nr:hypothetical protein [Vibrio parahaemolyticus]
MKKILLCCSAGMSTSMLVKKWSKLLKLKELNAKLMRCQ